VGLGAVVNVTAGLDSGTGPLLGTTVRNIGSAGGNGAVAYTDLRVDSAGAKRLAASAPGLTAAVSDVFTIAAGPQTITFDQPADRQYGDAPFALTATASSGLPVSFTVVGGPATVAGGTLTITGAGSVTVRATQAGSADYLAAPPVERTFAVARAPLTITAEDQGRVFGAPNPAFTAVYAGFVNGDDPADLTTPVTLATTATAASPVGTYAITAGGAASPNYTITFVNGTLTVAPASSATALATSANPSPVGAAVTFTATVTAVAPATGTPTGTVQFRTNGAALGAPVALAGGVAALATATLPRGTYAVTAEYGGSGNFLGSAGTLSPAQVINTAPTAGNVPLSRAPAVELKLRAAVLLAAADDPDGDPVTLQSVAAASAAGGVVMRAGPWIFYRQPAGFEGADSFAYVVADDGGLTATGTVSITVAVGTAPAENLVSVTPQPGGAVRVRFAALPGRAYTVQYAESLAAPVWQALGGAAADPAGDLEFTDHPAAGAPPRHYRLVFP
jgi:hypothetical protein